MFRAALLMRAPNERQSQCPLTVGWRSKLWGMRIQLKNKEQGE